MARITMLNVILMEMTVALILKNHIVGLDQIVNAKPNGERYIA